MKSTAITKTKMLNVSGIGCATVVQIEDKLIAVQFKQNVYLTDGWMVPDHILWFPFDSCNVRPYESQRKKQSLIDQIDLDKFNLF